jgi:FSR family fosmidomycin resistance protein-like MFS transporter
VIALRSFVYFGLVTIIPLYYVSELHVSKAFGNTALAAMLLGGAAGTLIGGRLADRFGRRAVLIGSMLLLPPLIVGFLASGPGLALVFAALAGAATIATFAVTIVMGQEYLPGRLGVAAGVTIGLSIGLGGAGAPLLGLIADAHGVRAVFELLAVLPVLALILVATLPAQAHSRRYRPSSAENAAKMSSPAATSPSSQGPSGSWYSRASAPSVPTADRGS